MILIWIIVSILIFSIIVLIHELWHFSAARFFWVRVEEFGLGIPPRAKKLWKDKKWTLYSLNRLPLWWFVKLTWESHNSLVKSEKYNLINKPAWQQSIIILAWVFMNFLLASFIFSILFFVWIKPIWVNTKIETDLNLKIIPTYEQAIESWYINELEWIILDTMTWGIAEKSWIIKWDILININWKKVSDAKIARQIIRKNINNNHNIQFEVINKFNKTKIINIIPPSKWIIWVYLSKKIEFNSEFTYKYWFIDSIKYWFLETYNHSLLTLKWLWILVKKIINPKTPKERWEAINQVSWPIWIVDFITNAISWWFVFLVILWAILSISLWVFNLLPIPALDWWRFIFIVINWIIQKIFWKKIINEYIESIMHVVFFIFLIALSIFIGYNDVVKIIDK